MPPDPASQREAPISAEDLVKRYGARLAVDSLSFSVTKGETLGFLGPNGAGKSTTIRMLVGASTPDGGSIRIAGESDPTRPAVKRRLGYVMQDLALYDELSARENLEFFARLQGLERGRRKLRVDFALDFAGLGDRGNDRVGSFSGGMKRRLNLVAALLHEPDVLFLDEPTVGVDPQSRAHIFANIEALEADGTTILYTTHSMEAAERLCDRVAIVDHGRILALDSVEALLREHGGNSSIVLQLRNIPDNAESLPGSLDGKTLTVESKDPFATLAELNALALDPMEIQVKRPSLEGAFLELTGRSLRDA